MIGQLKSLYDTQCEHCGGYHLQDLADFEDIPLDPIYLQIAQELMENPNVLINADLHLLTAKKLLEAITLDGNDMDVATNLESYLKRNIFHFAAAKSFVEIKYFRDGMVDENGRIKGFGTFHKWIADSGEIFNSTYLKAEYDMAHMSAIMAHKWETLDTEYLEFNTVGDNRVRPSHRALDKFTAPKSDPVWRKMYPPLDWGCRCTVIPGKETTKQKLTPDEAYNMVKPEIQNTIFENNVALSKVIFKNDHPYFVNAAGKEKQLSWENYGLHSMDKIRTYDLPEYFGKRNEEKNTLQFPNEVWMNPDTNSTTYLKFYQDKALSIQQDEFGNRVVRELNIGNDVTINLLRKGVLMHREL